MDGCVDALGEEMVRGTLVININDLTCLSENIIDVLLEVMSAGLM